MNSVKSMNLKIEQWKLSNMKKKIRKKIADDQEAVEK